MAEPVLFHSSSIELAPEEVERIISLLELEPPLKMLALACGVGRHSIEFAKRGYDVVGVDRTEIYLNRAKEMATFGGVNVEFVRANIREFVRENEFDLVINLWTSFSYFEDIEEDRKVLENVYKSLKDRGKFVI